LNSEHPNCPFCPENGKVNILAQNEAAYLVAALHPKTGEVMPGRYLIIPHQHITSMFDLPSDWQRWKNDLVMRVPEAKHGVQFNTSDNHGRQAGQRLDHYHDWVVMRGLSNNEKATDPSCDWGLSALIDMVNEGFGPGNENPAQMARVLSVVAALNEGIGSYDQEYLEYAAKWGWIEHDPAKAATHLWPYRRTAEGERVVNLLKRLAR
jgi:diadenosine tetraphosphate (Ap4A) HIT family hydrolase